MWKVHQQCSSKPLVTTHLTTLHHGSVLLLESFVQAGGALEVLVDTAHDAGLLTVDEGLGGEVVDAVVEAALDHLGVHLGEEKVRICWKGRQSCGLDVEGEFKIAIESTDLNHIQS